MKVYPVQVFVHNHGQINIYIFFFGFGFGFISNQKEYICKLCDDYTKYATCYCDMVGYSPSDVTANVL